MQVGGMLGAQLLFDVARPLVFPEALVVSLGDAVKRT